MRRQLEPALTTRETKQPADDLQLVVANRIVYELRYETARLMIDKWHG